MHLKKCALGGNRQEIRSSAAVAAALLPFLGLGYDCPRCAAGGNICRCDM